MATGKTYLAYNNSIIAMKRAVLERFLCRKQGDSFVPITPIPNGLVLRKFQSVLTGFKRLSEFSHPLSLRGFAECYHGPRRKRYLKAAEELECRSLTQKDFWLRFFLKLETYNFTDKPDPSPRGINPRHETVMVAYGAYIRPIEKKVYNLLANYCGHKVVFKGLNNHDRGSLIAQYFNDIPNAVAVSADASRFEASVSAQWLRFSHQVYKLYYPDDQYFSWLCEMTINNVGRARAPDGFMSFKREGGRSSGDMDTALGNCLISVVMAVGFFQQYGIKQYRIVCDGDDIILIISESNLHILTTYGKSYYEELGFYMKFENPAREIEKIDFCQSRPVYVDGSYIMIRSPKESLSKDAVSKKMLDSKKNYERWIASVGEGGIRMNGGVPVHQSYYSALKRNSNGAKPFENERNFSEWCRYKLGNMKRVYGPVSEETRYSYWLAFSITPDEQIALERFYDTITLPWGLHPEVMVEQFVLPI